jgi:hypothetical protein
MATRSNQQSVSNTTSRRDGSGTTMASRLSSLHLKGSVPASAVGATTSNNATRSNNKSRSSDSNSHSKYNKQMSSTITKSNESSSGSENNTNSENNIDNNNNRSNGNNINRNRNNSGDAKDKGGAQATDSTDQAASKPPPRELSPWEALTRQITHSFGWSIQLHPPGSQISTAAESILCPVWSCTVQLSVSDKRHILSECTNPNPLVGKQEMALIVKEDLAIDIATMESLPMVLIQDAFLKPPEIYSGTFSTWDYFWQHKPTHVGVDVEGHPLNFKSQAPVLVQVATLDYVILDIQRDGRLSDNLVKLLKDDSIVKILCDSPNHSDKKSLRLISHDHPPGVASSNTRSGGRNGSHSQSNRQVNDSEKIDALEYTEGSIIDLEAYASLHLGPLRGRGLARILTLSMPEMQARFFKPPGKESCARFWMIQQGRAPPICRLADLTREEQEYAAWDAWCTLYAYERLRDQVDEYFNSLY